MHRLFVFSVSALTLACGGQAPPAPKTAQIEHAGPKTTAERIATAYAGPKIRVAVGDFEELEAAKAFFEEMGWKGLGPLVTEQVLTGLVKTGRVAVLERQQLDKLVGNIKTEQESDDARFFDRKTTVEKGKFLGAQAILVGVLTRFEPNIEGGETRVGLPFLASLTYHQDKAVVGLELRLVDQETGRVLQAGSGEGEVTTRSAGAEVSYKGMKLGGGAWSRTPIGEATAQAAKQAMDALLAGVKQMPWEGSVASAKGKEKVFVDAGSELNLKKGDRFEVVRRGEAIEGPDGAIIGYDETAVGTLELTKVQPRMSVARMVEGEAPRAGDVVRLSARE